VLLPDTNWSHVAAARVEGLQAYYGSLLSDRSDDDLRLSGIGRLLALTSNDEANALTALKYAREFGTANVFQLAPGRSGNDRGRLGGEQRGRLLVGDDVTFPRMLALVRAGATVKRTELTEHFGMADYLQRYGGACVPLFVQQGKRVEVVTAGEAPPEPGSALYALVLEPDDEADDEADDAPPRAGS
jgi:hypothetical protein